MKLTSLLLLPALVAASSLAPGARAGSAKGIIASLTDIKASLYQVNATVNTFKPFKFFGFATALRIQRQTTTLSKKLQAAIDITKASPPLNTEETGEVASLVLGLTQPVNSTLNNIIAHRPSFQSAVFLVGSLSKTVKAILQHQQQLTATLGANLGPKLAPPFKELAPQVTADLVSLFNPAIAAFSGCYAFFCLPSFE